jgi:DNA-binding NarL/FixJ family response regulator
MKIVVISGHDAAEDFNQAERYGVDAYLVKPFSPRILVDLIERLEVPPGEMLVVPAESGFSGNTASN